MTTRAFVVAEASVPALVAAVAPDGLTLVSDDIVEASDDIVEDEVDGSVDEDWVAAASAEAAFFFVPSPA